MFFWCPLVSKNLSHVTPSPFQNISSGIITFWSKWIVTPHQAILCWSFSFLTPISKINVSNVTLYTNNFLMSHHLFLYELPLGRESLSLNSGKNRCPFVCLCVCPLGNYYRVKKNERTPLLFPFLSTYILSYIRTHVCTKRNYSNLEKLFKFGIIVLEQRLLLVN